MTALSGLEPLGERYRRTARAFAVLESIVPDMVTLMEAGLERVPIEQQLNALGAEGAAAGTERLEQLERDVVAFERSFEGLDRKIPSRWFRKQCRVTAATAEGFADYCRLLAQYASPADTARLERIRLIVDRLLEVVWPRAWATVDQRRELAAQALPASQVPGGVVSHAVTYFSAAAGRLESFRRLEELLRSDFILQTRGYVMSLREQALDPTIMIGAIELEHWVDEKIRRLATAESRDESELRDYLDDAERRLEDLFAQLRGDESTTEKGFEAFQKRRAAWHAKRAEEQRARARAELRRKERERWNPPKRRWPTWVAIAVLAALVWWRWPTGPSEVPLAAGELAEISPVLQSAVMSPAKRPRLLLARTEPRQWEQLDTGARKKTARRIAEALAARGLQNGTVFNGDSIAVEIREGEVLVVR